MLNSTNLETGSKGSASKERRNALKTSSRFDATPELVVNELDRYVIGHKEAKKAVAVALRNRWRRSQLSLELSKEIRPKNILLIGPTGVGKTEMARRLAELLEAPFLKTEVTKFTEVGYVGRDVESIIRDLVDRAVKRCYDRKLSKARAKFLDKVIDEVLDLLLPTAIISSSNKKTTASSEELDTRKAYRQKLLNGDLDDKEVEINVASASWRRSRIEISGSLSSFDEFSQQLQTIIEDLNNNEKNLDEKAKKRKVTVKQAIELLVEEKASKAVDEHEVHAEAIEDVEQKGIVFLDEIDKITQRGAQGGQNTDVSREGVQRDLLPLVEGTTVATKYGLIHTDHILFIASGAFHLASPADLMPEFQGRFPIRVTLKPLSADDFVRILTKTKFSLLAQYQAMLAVDKIELEFTDDGVQKIAEVAYLVNEQTENIGARRLNTVLELVLRDVLFDTKPQKVVVDANYVADKVSQMDLDEDRSRYIL